MGGVVPPLLTFQCVVCNSAYKKNLFSLPHFLSDIINDIEGCAIVVAVNESWSAKRLGHFPASRQSWRYLQPHTTGYVTHAHFRYRVKVTQR
jgi:hypothetical protein